MAEDTELAVAVESHQSLFFLDLIKHFCSQMLWIHLVLWCTCLIASSNRQEQQRFVPFPDLVVLLAPTC